MNIINKKKFIIVSLFGMLYCFFSISQQVYAKDVNMADLSPLKYTETMPGIMAQAGILEIKANNLENGFVTDKTTHISFEVTENAANYIEYIGIVPNESNVMPIHPGSNIIELKRPLEPGVLQTIFLLDNYWPGLVRHIASFEVVKGNELNVNPPILDIVDSHTVNVTGSTDFGNSVFLKIGGEFYEAVADSNNRFSIRLLKSFPAGTKIEAYAVDSNNNKSEVVYSTVVPAMVRPPSLDLVDELSTVITGSADSGDIVSIRIGGDLYREKANENNRFSINLGRAYPATTGIEAYSTDSFGETSEMVYAIVQPTNNFLLGVNRVLSVDSIITGRTIPNIRVEADVTLNTRGQIFEGTSDNNGNFTIDLRGYTFKAGTEITVTAFKGNGETKTQKIIVYPAAPSINSVRWTDSYITGRGDTGAIIYIQIEGNTFSGNVDAAGNFLIPVSGLQVGGLLQAYQISNGIKSDTVELLIQ